MSTDERIISLVAKFYGLESNDIIRKIRTKDIAEARQIIAYCLRLLNNLSFPAIGKILGGRDHTTIMHACANIARKIENEKEFGLKMETILNLVRTPEMLSVIEEDLEEDDENRSETEAEEVIEQPRGRLIAPTENLDLTLREREILDAYRNGMTLREIGDEKNITRERVRQLVTKAVLKEAGSKMKDGFEIDLEEYFKGEKLAHEMKRDVLSKEVRTKMLPEFLLKAPSYTSIHKFSQDVGMSKARLILDFPEVVSIIDQNTHEKEQRWSQLYTKCRGCGTITIPHVKKGFCEQCMGIRRGERRESVLQKHHECSVCSIERGAAIQKYGRDLYITKDGRVLCRGCFLQLTGGKLAEHRFGRLRQGS